MAVLGALVKLFKSAAEGELQDKRVEKFIRDLEQGCRKPLLHNFSGVDRFDAAAVLLNATLIHYLNESKDTERASLIERYIDRLKEEYLMAKKDLSQINATRAEVVALGIALREMALSLDSEIQGFQNRAATETSEHRKQIQAREEESARALDRQFKQMSQESRRRVELGIAANLEESKKAIEASCEQSRAALGQRFEALQQQSKELLDTTFGRMRQELDRELKTANEQNNSHFAEIDDRLGRAVTDQETKLASAEKKHTAALAELGKSFEELQVSVSKAWRWIFAGFATSTMALLAALIL